MTTLDEELPRQQARCRKMLEDVLEIGPSGAILAMLLRQSLAKAEKAAAEGDHFIFDRDEWDTVSGEPQNFWCDEAGTATVEDGTIAKLMLAAMKETP